MILGYEHTIDFTTLDRADGKFVARHWRVERRPGRDDPFLREVELQPAVTQNEIEDDLRRSGWVPSEEVLTDEELADSGLAGEWIAAEQKT